MSTLQFVFGASGSGKTEFCIRKALEEAGKDLNHNVYYLVPEQDTLAMQKRIVMHENNKGKGILNLDVLSFQRLYYASFSHANKKVPKSLDEMGKIMVLSLVAEKLNHSSSLQYFRGELEHLGFLEECKSLISECMQYDVSPTDLRDAAEKTEKKLSRMKMQDIALLYEGFLQWLSEHRKFTEEGIADLALEQIVEDPSLENATFILDGFTGFTPSQLHCLELLFERKNSILISLEIRSREEGNLYDKQDSSSLFYLTKDAVESVEGLAHQLNVKLLPAVNLNLFDSISGEKREAGVPYPRFRDIPVLQKICDDFATGKSFSSVEQGILLREAPDIQREVEDAGAYIHHLVKDKSYRYRDISVIIPDIESYRDILFSRWKDLQIPFFLEEDIQLFDSPYGKVIRSALLLTEKDFLFDSVFRYLRSFPYRGKEAEGLLDEWENIARARGLKGKKAFQSLLDIPTVVKDGTAGGDNVREKKSTVGEDSTDDKEQTDDKDLTSVKEMNVLKEQYSVEIKVLCQDLEFLFHFYEENADASLLKERMDCLFRLLQNTDLAERVEESLSFLDAEGMENRRESYHRSIEEIHEIMDRMRESLGEIPVSKKSFALLFDLAFSVEKLRQIPATLDQLVVGDLRRSRFHNPKAFLFLGLNSEFLPAPPGSKNILSEKEREFLRDKSYRLSPLAWEEGYIEKYYVYKAFLTPSQELYLSYPRALRDGKSGKPSSYILELKELFPWLKASYSLKEKREIYNEKKAREELARELPAMCKKSIFQEKLELEHRFKTEAFSLLHYLWNKEEYREKVEKLLDALFFENRKEALSTELSKALYGETIKGSVTRMELFTACPFAHFLQYGLKLKERKTKEVQAFDIGNLYHKMVELFFKRMLKSGNDAEFFGEKMEKILKEVIEESMLDPQFAVFQEGGRNQYLLRKLSQNGKRILWALGKQVLAGDLRPKAIEQDFYFEEEGLSLRGRIDRVDSFLTEDQKTLFLKVLDYKSGKKDFSLKRLFAGLDLQLPLYMDYVLREEGKKHKDMEILPSAMFYFTMDNPALPYDPEKDAEKERLKALKPKGLVNISEESLSHLEKLDAGESLCLPVQVKNGAVEEKGAAVSKEKFDALLSYAKKKMREEHRRIKAGEKDIFPMEEGNEQTACSYCPYHSICGFDENIPNFRYRRLEDKTEEEFWTEILKDAEVKMKEEGKTEAKAEQDSEVKQEMEAKKNSTRKGDE